MCYVVMIQQIFCVSLLFSQIYLCSLSLSIWDWNFLNGGKTPKTYFVSMNYSFGRQKSCLLLIMKNQHLNTCKWTIPCVLANSSKPCIIQMNWRVWKCCPLVRHVSTITAIIPEVLTSASFFKLDILFIPGNIRHPEIIKSYSYIQKEGKNKHPESSLVFWDHTSGELQL